MSGWRRLATSGVMVLALAATLAGCSSEGDLEITNSGPGEVTVDTGDDSVVVCKLVGSGSPSGSMRKSET